MKKLFKLKHVGVTNIRGVRIVITNIDTNETWTISRDHSMEYREQAIKYIEEYITYLKHEQTFGDMGAEYMLFS
jgi:hypothetical protein